MSYLLVSNYQNYGHDEDIYSDKKEATKAFAQVKKHPGAQSAFLYKLVAKGSWVRNG